MNNITSSYNSSQSIMILIARIALAALFVIFGFSKLTALGYTSQYMASLHMPAPYYTALLVTAIELIPSILIIFGLFTRPMAYLYIVYSIATAFIGHPYWSLTDTATATAAMIDFYKNISLAGGFLLLAVTGPGSMALDRIFHKNKMVTQ